MTLLNSTFQAEWQQKIVILLGPFFTMLQLELCSTSLIYHSGKAKLKQINNYKTEN